MIIRGSLPVWWLARVHVPSGTVIERRPAVLICADEDSSAATVEWNGQRYAVTIDQLKLREENNGTKPALLPLRQRCLKRSRTLVVALSRMSQREASIDVVHGACDALACKAAEAIAGVKG